MRAQRCCFALLAVLLVSPGAGHVLAAEPLPIFDTHLHYSESAWSAHPPADVLSLLRTGGVERALTSSSPDDGTITLHRADAHVFIPVLRPYRGGIGTGNWMDDAETPAYLATRLKLGVHQGLGEFHLHGASQAGTPTVRAVVGLAGKHRLFLHVHAGAEVVEALYRQDAALRILWAHGGFEAPERIAQFLRRYPLLLVDTAFRDGDMLSEGKMDPAWLALFREFPERIMIGSDTYVTSRWDGYLDILAQQRRWLAALPEALAKRLAHENARKHFGGK
ncbi:MAG: amidohydrolase [Deltaproteobacteria bacterium]|nr:amidohydrolase [Deltaproteobacteria bacterium]